MCKLYIYIYIYMHAWTSSLLENRLKANNVSAKNTNCQTTHAGDLFVEPRAWVEPSQFFGDEPITEEWCNCIVETQLKEHEQ